MRKAARRLCAFGAAEPALLTMLVAGFFVHLVWGGRVLMLRDLFFDYYAWHSFIAGQLHQGVLPLWSPHTGCGEPLVGELEPALFYPPTLIFLFLAAPTGAVVLMAAHFVLAALSVYWLCCGWKMTPSAALFAAVVAVFNSIWLCKIEYLAEVNASCWLPVLLALFAAWERRPTWARLSLVSVAFALQLLAGWPEAVLFSIGTLGLYAAVAGYSRRRAAGTWMAAVQPVIGLAAAGIGAVALSMVQILPALEVVANATRSAGDPAVETGSLDPLAVLGLLVPSVYGTQGHFGRYWAPGMFEYWLGPPFIGVAPIVLLLLWPTVRLRMSGHRTDVSNEPHLDSRAIPFLLWFLGFTWLYAMGRYTPFFPSLLKALPFLAFTTWPAKALMCSTLALACLAGAALHGVLAFDAVRERRHVAAWTAASVLAVVLAASTWLLLRDHGSLGRAVLSGWLNADSVLAPYTQNIPWALLTRDTIKVPVVAAGTAVLLLLLTRARVWRRWIAMGFTLLTFLDMTVTTSHLYPSAPANVIETRGENPFSAQAADPRSRFLSFMDWPLLYGAESVEAYRVGREIRAGGWAAVDGAFAAGDALTFPLRDMSAVLDVLGREDTPQAARDRLLRMLHCGLVIDVPNIEEHLLHGELLQQTLTHVPDPLPRAYVAGGVRVLDTPEDVYEALASDPFDPRELALADKESVQGVALPGETPRIVEHQVQKITSDTPNCLRIRLETKGPGVLVVSDTWFPGWSALVNGTPTRLFKVNGAFRGLVLARGAWDVELAYAPTTYRVGLAVSLITAGLYGVAAFWFIWRRATRGMAAHE